MKKAIVQQNKHWEGKYENLFGRDIQTKLVKQLKAREIQVLLGVRRSGKSTIFKLLINYLIDSVSPKNILYLNLDDPFFSDAYEDVRFLEKIIETAEKIVGESFQFLFLDEIQNVRQWEKFVKSIYDNERFRKIFITGSNSSLLESEYAELLSGRYIADVVYPLSFKEKLKIRKIENSLELFRNKIHVIRELDSSIEFGGYPEIIKHDDPVLKREILLSYFDTIVLKDCIANGKIRETKTFRQLTNYLITNATTSFSYNGLAKTLNSNENSVKEFIRLLENCFLMQEIKRFSFSLKKQIKAKKKVYCVDNGILANVSFRFSKNRGKLFENLVYSEFLKRNKEIYYYSNKNECDFIVKDNEELSAFQATYELNDENRKREVKGLKEALKDLNIKQGFIITYDQNGEIDGIPIVAFWEYFAG